MAADVTSRPRNGERALKYIFFVYTGLCWSLTYELQRARVNRVHSKQAVPWYRNEREWYENGVRFSGLTIRSAGLMGENGKLHQCDKNCLHLAIFKVFCFEGGTSFSSALHRHPKLMGQDFQLLNHPSLHRFSTATPTARPRCRTCCGRPSWPATSA